MRLVVPGVLRKRGTAPAQQLLATPLGTALAAELAASGIDAKTKHYSTKKLASLRRNSKALIKRRFPLPRNT